MYLLSILSFSFAVLVNSDSNKNVLIKFKSDVDKVGKDVETLVFDIVEKVMDEISVYQVNGDYYTSEENIPTQKSATQHSIAKKVLDNILENTTEEYLTEKSSTLTPTMKSISRQEELLHNRLKRSVDENSSNLLTELKEEKPETGSSVINSTQVCFHSLQDQAVEQQFIDDLKQEIHKLHDLVLLLRDQQRTISLLNHMKNVDEGMSSRFSAQDLLKILDYANSRNINEDKDRFLSADKKHDDNRDRSITYEDLANIKNNLKDALTALNKTRDILTAERRKEILLEKELSDQKLDLNFLKMMIRKLYKNNMHPQKENGDDDILGAVRLPKELPEHNNASKDNSTLTTRASELDDLGQMLRIMHRPKKTDIESRMLELQREIEKQKEEEDLMEQLKSLEKYIKQRKNQESITPSPNVDSEMVKTLKLALKLIDGGKSRNLHDETELELQNLQDAIDNLNPNNQLDTSSETSQPSESDMKQFQMMFNKFKEEQDKKEENEVVKFQKMMIKMFQQQNKKENPVNQFQVMHNKITNQGKRDELKVSPEVKEQKLLLKEVIALREQLESIEKLRVGNDKIHLSGYGPNIPGNFGNFASNYPPYMNPQYQNILNNGGMHAVPNNQYYNHNFVKPYPYFTKPKGTETFQGPNQNSYQNSVENKPFGIPNHYDTGANVEQNSYQAFESPVEPKPSLEQGHYQSPPKNVPSFKYNSGTINSHQIPIQYNQNDFEVHKYQKPSEISPEITKHSSLDQESDRYQFFPATQEGIDAKPFPEPFFSPQSTFGSGAGQPETYSPKIGENVIPIYQKVEDLKTQIYNLQNIIDGLNKANYNKNPQSRETVFNLEKQIHELKGIIDSMNPDPNPAIYAPNAPKPDQSNFQPDYQSDGPQKSKQRRSVKDNEDSQLYDQVVSGLKQLIFEKGNNIKTRSSYDDIQDRINHLKYQLESKTHSSKAGLDRHFNSFLPPSYQPSYYQHSSFAHLQPVSKFEVIEANKNDIFTSVILKIFDKILAATPAIFGKIFGFGLTELSNFGDSSGYRDNYNVGYGVPNDLQKLFKSLGFFGYGPMILLRIIDGFTTFVKILKKNEFFKNFLMPALILLTVAGAVVFLIWWLQPNAEYINHNQSNYKFQPGSYSDKYNQPYSNYNYQGNGHSNYNNYGYGGNYKPPVYSRSYFDDGRKPSNFY